MGFFTDLFKGQKEQISKAKPNSLEDALTKCKKYNNDLIIMFSKGCTYCSKYGSSRSGKGKVYSISGKSKKYPSMMKIPADLVIGKCPKCDKCISFSPYFEGINS